MGKLIRNGIEYGGGNGTDIFKVTQAEYDALVQAGTLVHNALYVISDAPNLNAKASDIEYASGVNVKQAIDGKASATVLTPTLTCPRCNMTVNNSKCYQIGKIIFYSAEITFGAKIEAQAIYFLLDCLAIPDFAFGELFYDTGDTIHKVAKGGGNNLWVTNGTTRILATDVENKSKMFLNVVITKA